MKKYRSAKCAHWESLSNTSAVLAGCHILGPCHAASDAASRWGVTPLQVGPLFVINPCAGNMGTCRHHHWPLGRGQVGVLNFDIDTFAGLQTNVLSIFASLIYNSLSRNSEWIGICNVKISISSSVPLLHSTSVQWMLCFTAAKNNSNTSCFGEAPRVPRSAKYIQPQKPPCPSLFPMWKYFKVTTAVLMDHPAQSLVQSGLDGRLQQVFRFKLSDNLCIFCSNVWIHPTCQYYYSTH